MKGKNVIVEVLRPDGSTSLWIGTLVRKEEKSITLVNATWIVSTGRRHKFLRGEYDGNAEWEPHPDGVEIELDAPILWWGEWTHDLIPLRKAK